MKGIFSLFSRRKSDISDLILDPFAAMEELERRQKDPLLKKKVEEYLSGDIPEYFKDGPILYLARHIVTPNFETLRFIHLMRQLGLKTVVSQDSKGMFVPYNQVKKALCKLPICHRVSQKGKKLNEHYENVTIVDFDEADGRTFSEIKTLWGEGLIDFHTRLFTELLGKDGDIERPDDAEWIDRHHRESLLAHYKHLLALFLVHGIFFENYDMHDKHEAYFVKNILRPAYLFVEKKFGYRPLIVQIYPTTFESGRFWLSYPKRVLDIVRESMKGIVV
jgi:hypothetical protein